VNHERPLRFTKESSRESLRDFVFFVVYDFFFIREERMKRNSSYFAVLALIILSVAAISNLDALAVRKQTFTGEVGDAMCGRKHMEDEPAAECTRACVAHGSKYALIVGDKTYTLDTADKSALATLDQQAGRTATVTGTLDGDTITVQSVTPK
jgi:hypothetical protein